MADKLYYYKAKDKNCFLIDKHPLDDLGDYEEITKKQYENYQKQSQEQINNVELSDIEVKRRRIMELKSLLKASDYQAIKYAEGILSAKEYASIKNQRQEWRDEINELEQELENEQ